MTAKAFFYNGAWIRTLDLGMRSGVSYHGSTSKAYNSRHDTQHNDTQDKGLRCDTQHK
jgi:hypothetical protein